MLAADPLLFIEDFSDDYEHDLGGFDQADNDPATPPDRLLIQRTINARGSAFFPTAGLVNVGSTFQPSSPFALGILGPGSDTIRLPPPGTLGGLADGEEITAVAIGYAGLGTISVVGNNGVKTITFFGDSREWHSVTVTANSPSDSGQEVGAIQNVVVSTFEVVYIDDVALLISGIIANNPPVANPDSVSTLPGVPVDIDPLANDGDADGDPIRLVRVEPLSAGSGTLSFENGQFTFTPAAGFHGIASFNYFITDDRVPARSEVIGSVRTPL